MFGKITKQQMASHLNRAKDFLGNSYNKAKNFLGDVDSGIKTFKSIYGVIHPILQSYGVNVNQPVMKALTNYDNIRSNVMENHDRVVNDLNTIKKNVKFDFT